MSEKLADKLALYLVRLRLVEESKTELYSYAINYLLLLIIPVFIFATFCIISHNILLGFVEIISFLLIRKYSGGYHFDSSSICLIFSSFSLIAMALLSGIIRPSLYIIITLALCDTELLIIGPIISVKHSVSDIEKRHYHRYMSIILLICNIFFIILSVLQIYRLANCIAIVIIVVSLSHIICLFGKNKELYYR